MVSKIPVMEIFGPTIQGEGAVIGQKTMFVRTAGCDYRCSWCDSSFTWDGSGKDKIQNMEPEQIWAELTRLGGDGFSFVTISGGNPALIKNLDGLVHLLKEKQMKIALETQGSKWQDWFYHIDEITISPKPPSSNMNTDFSMLDSIMNRLENNKISLKIVVFNDEDYEYAKNVHFRYPNVPFFLQIGNEHLNAKDDTQLLKKLIEKYEWLVDKGIRDPQLKNVRILPQLHTYIWGNKQGV